MPNYSRKHIETTHNNGNNGSFPEGRVFQKLGIISLKPIYIQLLAALLYFFYVYITSCFLSMKFRPEKGD